jgi:hypothetical protein
MRHGLSSRVRAVLALQDWSSEWAWSYCNGSMCTTDSRTVPSLLTVLMAIAAIALSCQGEHWQSCSVPVMQRRQTYASLLSKIRVVQRLAVQAGICAGQLTPDCRSCRPYEVRLALVGAGSSSSTAMTAAAAAVTQRPRIQSTSMVHYKNCVFVVSLEKVHHSCLGKMTIVHPFSCNPVPQQCVQPTSL